MKTDTYNGWTNRETWLIRLWIDNDQGSSEHWAERAAECLSDSRSDDNENGDVDAAASELATELESSFDEEMDTLLGSNRSSFWADLLGGALAKVDWNEVAASYITDASEEA